MKIPPIIKPLIVLKPIKIPVNNNDLFRKNKENKL